jgi:predicted transcriptional regulator
MSHREAFIETKNYFGITGSDLHRVTGVSKSHLSEFINRKRDITTDLLDRLITGMEELEPGALQFYTDELRGRDYKVIASNPKALVDAMDNEQLSELMFAIAAKMGSKTSNQAENKQLVISC